MNPAGKGRIMWLGVCDRSFTFSRNSLTSSEAGLQYWTIYQRNMIHPGVSKSICLKRKVFTVHFCGLIILEYMLSSVGAQGQIKCGPFVGPITPGELLLPLCNCLIHELLQSCQKIKRLTTSSSVMHNISVISAELEVVSQFKPKPAG